MQVLMICRDGEQLANRFPVFSFRSALGCGLFADTLESITLEGNRLFSQSEYDFLPLARQVELFPSYLVSTDNDEVMAAHPRYALLQTLLARAHPYCQHLLFDTPQINAFFLDCLGSQSEGAQVDGEAFVHIASVQDRVLKIHRLTLAGQYSEGLEKKVKEQLEYEFAKLYYALVSSLNQLGDRIDKSISLKVFFQVNTTIDLQVSILQVEVVNIHNYHRLVRFHELLRLVLADLLQIKQLRHAKLGSNNSNYVRACAEISVTCEPIGRNMYFLKRSDRQAVYIPYHRTMQTKASIDAAESKVTTNIMLKNNNLAVSNYIFAKLTDVDDSFIKNAFESMMPPFVIKPTDQSAGYGVYLNIVDHQMFATAVTELRSLEGITDILIEEQFSGSLYRFIIIGNRVEAVMKSSYPVVIGNGINSISELIRNYNLYNSRKIRIDNGLELYLSSLELNLDVIPARGKKITVSLKKNGDVTQNVTQWVKEKYKKIALEAHRAVGLKVNGVDMMIAPTGEYRIIELNPVPAFYPHLAPNYGDSLDLYKTVIDFLLDNVSLRLYDCADIMCYHS